MVINLTVTSDGRQFDRLALMYLGDVEVFRTSTAEPTKLPGIIWNYMKEMQMYNALWKEPQTLIFDLGNIVNDIYTGLFNTTLTATFFTVPHSPATADIVLPISSRASASGSGSVFQVPDQNATTGHVLPRSIDRAVVSLSACGQQSEEFWYSNVPSSEVNTFADTSGSYPGQGTFREVQLLIDGTLAGVSWPFPVIFTGGIVPGFWRPIVGIDAFDLRQHEIDITPWLGYLLDGRNHTFQIKVASVSDDGQGHATIVDVPGEYWLVSGSIFLFNSPNHAVTTGTKPSIDSPPIDLSFDSSYTQTSNGTNATLTYNTKASRKLSISSTIKTSGKSRRVSWTQDLSYSNYNDLTDLGFVQFTKQSTTGTDKAVGARDGAFSYSYNYPLTVNSTFQYTNGGANLFLAGQLSRGEEIITLGNPVFPNGLQNFNTSVHSSGPTYFSVSGDQGTQQNKLPKGAASSFISGKGVQGTKLDTTQVGTAQYQSIGNTSSSFGTTEQWFSFTGVGANGGGGVNEELYSRHVKAVNTTVVEDEQTLVGRSFEGSKSPWRGQQPYLTVQAQGGGVRQFLGHGPGRSGRGGE